MPFLDAIRLALQRVLGAAATLVAGHAGVHERQLDVVQGAGARQEVERLEDEADLLVADAGQFVIVQFRDVVAIKPVFSLRR